MLSTQEKSNQKKYKTYISGEAQRKYPHNYIQSAQRRVEDETGKKYIISMHQFEIITKEGKQTCFGFEASFRNKNGKLIDISVNAKDKMSIQEAEMFYESMWNTQVFEYLMKWDKKR